MNGGLKDFYNDVRAAFVCFVEFILEIQCLHILLLPLLILSSRFFEALLAFEVNFNPSF